MVVMVEDWLDLTPSQPRTSTATDHTQQPLPSPVPTTAGTSPTAAVVPRRPHHCHPSSPAPHLARSYTHPRYSSNQHGLNLEEFLHMMVSGHTRDGLPLREGEGEGERSPPDAHPARPTSPFSRARSTGTTLSGSRTTCTKTCTR